MKIVYERSTNKDLNQAIKSLEENLKENEFGVLWKLNFKDTLEEKGLELKDDFVVLEVCNPKQAKVLLDRNSHVGYLLPCKMVVRSDNENTYIGMTSPETLIGLFDEPELNEVAKEVEALLKTAIKSSL